ncbi:hypothetical protein SAMN02982929_03787 [Saccharopolyspora kobensis]|uniref:DUF3800 domain-containing protein n=1 Tax=Saccharopolyspora kobensis TaxID=146035 RepID=A0A1H6D1B4_9PSEU|nr:hypothetical protein [Saccharopolyspora kobensis]SEG78798.1 hypothetical protein SAMN02982929_03787 [Saccharopolyspora kobensis]SFD06321.1 hypothetical protein SAMN05216506_102382 [Saccharopolyspora kobensis]
MFVHAYVDESYDLTIGVYILTATIVDLTDAEDFRSTMRGLRRGGEKLHWSKEPPHRRTELTKVLSSLLVHSVVAIGCSKPLFPERGRRKCLESLLPELETHGADIATFETRQKHSNKLDADMVDACRQKRLITSNIRITFAPGTSEPLLWIPDIVCGIALSAERGDEKYLRQAGERIRIIRINAR